MAEKISLTCPTCGGRLQVTSDIEKFSCEYCGNDLIIQREGNNTRILLAIEELVGIKSGVKRTASELAIPRVNKELEALKTKRWELARQDRPGAAGGLLGIGGLFLIFSVIIDFNILFTGAGIVFLILGYVQYLKKKKDTRRIQIRNDVAKMDKEILEKTEELNRHISNVKG